MTLDLKKWKKMAESVTNADVEFLEVVLYFMLNAKEMAAKLEETDEKLTWFLAHISPTQDLGYSEWCKSKGWDGWS